MIYRLLRLLLAPLLDFFYRRSSLGGAIPDDGPLVVVGNHPNGLIDPMLVGTMTRRELRFLGKAPLFRMPVVGWLLRAARCLPVYRQKDSPGEQGKNEATFEACHEALAQGDAVCIFPEGMSHSAPHLSRMKTGAARIALGAEAARGFSLGVRVVPVGLTYREKNRFRGEAAVQVGEPVPVADLRAEWERDPVKAAEALTARIGEALSKVTLNVARWEDLPALEAAEAVWSADRGLPGSKEERERRVRAFAEGLSLAREHDPERVQALRRRVMRFAERVRRMGADLDDLDARYTVAKVARFVVRNLVALLLGLPVALAGVAAWVVPYLFPKLVVRLTRPVLDLEATYKLGAILLGYPLWAGAVLASLALWAGGWWALGFALLAPPCGVYAVYFWEGREEALEDAAVFFRLGLRRSRKERLLARRARLAADIDALAAEVQRLERR